MNNKKLNGTHFENIKSLPTRNIVNVNRFSGYRLLVPESLPDHISDMVAMGLYICSLIPIIDRKELIYKISIHDYDEALYSDIPRPFKYHNSRIRLEIENTVDEILKDNFDEELINDIHNSKNDSNIESLVVKLLDGFQCLMKQYDEVVVLGNMSLLCNIRSNISYCYESIEKIKSIDYINENDKLTLIDIFGNIVDNVNNELMIKLNK